MKRILVIVLVVFGISLLPKARAEKYWGVAVYGSSDCSADSIFTAQVFPQNMCQASGKYIGDRETLYELYYGPDDPYCQGEPNPFGNSFNNQSRVYRIGACQPFRINEATGQYRDYVIWFATDSLGPFSVIPQGAWAAFATKQSDCSGEKNYVQYDPPNSCWGYFSEVSCDANNFYVRVYPDSLTCEGNNFTAETHPITGECVDMSPAIPDSYGKEFCPPLAAPCTGAVNVVPRSGPGSSWQSNGINYQILDISVTNTGTCAINSARLPQYIGGSIFQSWNVHPAFGAITIFGPILPGQTYSGAGVIVGNYNPSSPTYGDVPGPDLICGCNFI